MKYISKYSNNKEVSAAQFITELICEHKAKIEKRDLHFRFWLTSTYWTKFYKNQIATANKLLAKYDAKAIVSALNDSKAAKIYSLRAPHLLPIIEHHAKVQANIDNTPLKDVSRVDHTNYKSRTPIHKNNLLSKLDEETIGD
jgi:hypothetical protein